MTCATCRDRLRLETAAAHTAAEDRLSGLSMRDPAGLGRFLMLQSAVWRRVSVTSGPVASGSWHAAAAAELAAIRAALAADLAALDIAPSPACAAVVTVSPLAALYMMIGSRRGNGLLARDWRLADDHRVRAAGRFLALHPLPALWTRIRGALAAMPAHGADADRLVAEALSLFQLFLTPPANSAPAAASRGNADA